MIGIKITTPVTMLRVEAALMKAFRRGLRDLANAAKGEWEDAAGRNLHRTRVQYQSAIKLKKIDPDNYELTLHHPDEKTNWLVTALEVGVGEFDIKKGLLVSDAATRWSPYHKTQAGKRKLGVPFVDVPFRTGKTRSQSKPNKWRRVSERSSGWKHPGFKPAGGGGLTRPLREEVQDYIKDEAKTVFGPLLARLKV